MKTASRIRAEAVSYARLELQGIAYAVVPEDRLRRLCRSAEVEPVVTGSAAAAQPSELELANEALALKLIARRQAAGVTQANLAHRAGVRVETLNRIERARTTPDFGTLRKIARALGELESAARECAQPGRRKRASAADDRRKFCRNESVKPRAAR